MNSQVSEYKALLFCSRYIPLYYKLLYKKTYLVNAFYNTFHSFEIRYPVINHFIPWRNNQSAVLAFNSDWGVNFKP